MNVEAIKDAITALPEEERVAIAAWLNAQSMDDWDREMASDFSPGGRGFHLVEKVKGDIRAGRFRAMSKRENTE